jgi:large subunit ribosomal protein L15
MNILSRHQKSRTKIPLHFEGGEARLVKKYPLLRGKGKNKSAALTTTVISLETLNKFRDGATVDKESLLKMNLISEDSSPLKILANGKLTKKLTVKIPVSEKAQKQIEKAGGKVVRQ